MICSPEHPIKLIKTFVAKLLIYDLGEKGSLTQGEPVMVHSYSAKGPAKLQKFIKIVN